MPALRFVTEFVQQLCGFGDVVDAEDDESLRRSGLEAAVGVVDVDLVLAQTGGGATQFSGAVREADDGSLGLLEDHAQAAEDGLGGWRIIDDEAGEALALFDERLEG